MDILTDFEVGEFVSLVDRTAKAHPSSGLVVVFSRQEDDREVVTQLTVPVERAFGMSSSELVGQALYPYRSKLTQVSVSFAQGPPPVIDWVIMAPDQKWVSFTGTMAEAYQLSKIWQSSTVIPKHAIDVWGSHNHLSNQEASTNPSGEQVSPVKKGS